MENNLTSKLTYKKKSVYESAPETVSAAKAYSEGYKKFLDAAKTEREAVAQAIILSQKNGYTEYKLGDDIRKGDKKYYNNRGKSLYLFRVGTEDIGQGIRIVASHIDSPRIDLKQCPLYEEGGMAYFKTHYYGGIRKYQWLSTALSLHGVVVKQDGDVINVNIGEDDADPVFCINDLLPHLAQNQAKTPLSDAFDAEKMNVLVGSEPISDGDENAIKLNVLNLLYEKYGITEEDFLSAELCLVPNAKARDTGFDRSMICAYGHDDRVCAYPSLTALFDLDSDTHTVLCVLADKEEIGSDGNTGMQCDIILDIINELSVKLGSSPALVRANSKCLSADVSAAFDPNYADVYEKKNAAMISCGAVITKFTGSRGKSATNDASAEFLAFLRKIFAKDGVVWQTAELGRVDVGGGGTVAKYIAKHNIETVDLGVPVLSMHAPQEIVSKVDLYHTHLAILAFYK